MKHPMGVYAISITEMWERFSFFIFSGILILFMIEVLHFSSPFSNFLYGIIVGACYLLQLSSGYITDKYLGNRKAIIVGAILMIISQLIFTYDASLYTLTANVPVHSSFIFTYPETVFIIGVIFLAVGASLFKVSATSFVSLFYKDNEEALDSGFTIFYMLSNIGAFLAPLILTIVVGVHNPQLYQYGFLLGVITICLGLITFFIVRKKYLCSPNGEALGITPVYKLVENKKEEKLSEELSEIDRDRIKASVLILIVIMLFYIALEQTSTSFIVLAMNYVNNVVPFTNISLAPEFYLCLDPLFVILLSPVFIRIMNSLSERNEKPSRIREPSSISKLAYGLVILTLGFIVLLIPTYASSAKMSMVWIFLFNVFLVMGELLIMPIGLSLISRLAPVKHASLMIGVLLGVTAVSEVLTGLFASALPETYGKTNTLFYFIPINNLASFFWVFIVLLGAVFIIWMVFRPRIKKLTHGIE